MTMLPKLSLRSVIIEGDQDPGSPALEAPGSPPVTWRELRDQIRYMVSALNTQDLGRNDRIAIVMPPGPETAALMVSVMAGSTAVYLSPSMTKPECERMMPLLKIKALLVRSDYDPPAAAVAGNCGIPVLRIAAGKRGNFTLDPSPSGALPDPVFAGPDDAAILVQTTGTTGVPKVFSRTQHQHLRIVQTYVTALGLLPADKNLHILPLDTALGAGTALLSSLVAGGSLICPRDFIPADFPGLLKTSRPTYFFASPVFHQAILRELEKVPATQLNHHSLRFIVTGSAAMKAETRTRLETLLNIPVIEAYGASESGGAVSINLPAKQGSAGRPVIEHLEIWNGNQEPAGPYEQGEIVVRGETVFHGYEDASDRNGSVFHNGWYRTGDTGYLDGDGYLFLTGRLSEMINKGGRKISPAEIDAVLLSHPGVRDAMSFKIPDADLGENIGAMVVLSDRRVTENGLRTFLLDNLSVSKMPKKILFVDAIPKNALGKPLRQEGTARFSSSGSRLE